MTKTLPWTLEVARPLSAAFLHLAAGVLRAASAALDRMAVRVAAAEAARDEFAHGTVEFHPIYRDAGAPEGAVYVNGKFVGTIEGVKRL